ncbi:MAG: hypothetical protein Q4E75_05920 [bacterium]|nr:hypothetical protein [bacterium]
MKKDNKLIVIIIIAAIIIAFGIVLGINYNTWFGKKDIEPQKVEKSMDENAGDYVEEEVENYNGANVILPGWTELHIEANTKEITKGIDFYNPSGNNGYYYLTFQLKINNEVLYESGLVAPGKHIQKITLKRALKEGVYDATIFMQPYKWDKATPTNNANVRIKLVVG